ncbi:MULTISPECIES: heavy metal translocating P-type ATPase [Afipia]|jgi:Cd2+/Zn2+-exporting ATPase|uniref:P-type Zn(2+) transporter n=2 Tax=Afipia TaxID=1033 RepID=K8NUI7_9BRAD|nr:MULTISPECIES: heavy metal translocating P-type ATPase [Afipia]EKS32154.1 heavy metal translocating P-type ATPase [Afipia clevelandensis ATCC 49720]MBB5053545.1 Cd2+/Zn2+-exporting ATPase [Afipia massiliensis]
MTIDAGVSSLDAILAAVAATGMTATLRADSPTTEPLSFRVTGLDCQNEVRQLKSAVGPLIGGEDNLFFDTKAGRMDVTPSVSVATDAIKDAVATTGMVAELLRDQKLPLSVPAADPSCTGCASDLALTPLVPAAIPGEAVFKIHGMDCGDEVAALKREVGPLVGEDRLVFDLINGRMSVSGNPDATLAASIEKAVARTGMRAEPWSEGPKTEGAHAEDRRRHTQSLLTTASGLLTAIGFAIHATSAGSVLAALSETPGVFAPAPIAAILAYALAIVCAIRYVAPKALLSARRLRPDMNLLMVIAVVGAVAIHQWFEAATVSFFFALALALEAWSLGRARRAVAALMELAPAVARVKFAGGTEKDIPVAAVSIGAHIVVRPGDKIPLDGIVLTGASEVNQAPITGESAPVSISEGSVVYAGTINGEGALEIETTKGAQDTTLARIIKMVGSAQSRRAPSEQWVERFARIYTPSVMGLAVAVLIIPPLIFGGAWDVWFYRALVLLVIACPCALVISTPVSIVAALAGAAKQGVLVKGGVHLETPSKLKAIAMDKTGTLTQGRPKVVELVTFNNHSEGELLKLAAALEARSEHPLAHAILEKAAEAGIAAVPANGVQAVRGKGVVGRIGAQEAWLGSRRLIQEYDRLSNSAEALQAADALAIAGRTVIGVGDDREIWGLIAVADAVRPEAKRIVADLHAAGIERVVMLTGDNKATAEMIAQKTGVDEVHAELLPEQKVEAVERLVARYGHVAMIGDGVNDAPAMARANVGIAMGAIGSDAAIETADIALMQDDLSRLPWLIGHSKATLAIIRQNIGFSLAVKLLFTGLTIVGWASLWGAIAADVGASLLVVLNGLRLLSRDQSAQT